MARSRSPELAAADLDRLVDIADQTLRAALAGVEVEPPLLDALPGTLHARVGVFVTLTVDGLLNGCIGDVEGRQPLAHGVARLALAAAFDDPRLPALRAEQYERLEIEVSVLSPLDPVEATSRTELAAAVEPHRHGLVVRSGRRSGLFLPSVWAQLPHHDDFLDHLWHKAGLVPGTWPRDLTAWRFTVQHHARPASGDLPSVPCRTCYRRD